MSANQEFKPIPTKTVDDLLDYNDQIGEPTYGLWVIKAANVPNQVLTTLHDEDFVDILPSWMIRGADLMPGHLWEMATYWNQTGVKFKNAQPLPYYCTITVEGNISSDDVPYPLMPVVAEAAYEDVRGSKAKWQDRTNFYTELNKTSGENPFLRPYVQLCLEALRLADQYEIDQAT